MSFHELTITIAEPFRDALIQRLVDAGSLGVIEKDEDIIAFYPGSADIKTITDDLAVLGALLEKSEGSPQLTFRLAEIPDQDWNKSWKEGFVPLDVGERFTILPPWEEKKKGRINLVIDPAMAFGTGHHETTRSCLVLLERYAKKSGKDSLLDVGTGTGILAIAASKLSYHHVVAVDTDLLAVEAARTNSALNQTKDIDIREGSVAAVTETFDLIIANILSGVLVLLAPEARTAPQTRRHRHPLRHSHGPGR